MSTLNCTKIQHETGVGDNITLDTSGNVEIAGNLEVGGDVEVAGTSDLNGDVDVDGDIVASGDVQMASLNGGQLAGFRNLLINGDFRVWQRFGRTQTLNSSSFLADRWSVNFTGTSIVGDQNVVDGNYRLTVATTGVSEARLEQKIEAQNCRWLINKQVTLSFYTTCANPKIILNVRNGSNASESITGGYISPVSGANNLWTWTGTITTSDGEIGNTSNGRGIEFALSFDDQATSLPNATYEFWNFQLEPGPVATPFEHRSIGIEGMLCARYYFAFNTTYSGPNNYALADSTDLTIFNYVAAPFFRAVPSITLTRTGAISGLAGEPTTGLISSTGFFIKADKNGGSGGFNWQGTITADAEL